MLQGLNADQKADVKNAFAECLTNAPDFVETTLDSATDGFEDPVENLEFNIFK